MLIRDFLLMTIAVTLAAPMATAQVRAIPLPIKRPVAPMRRVVSLAQSPERQVR
jgi:hypothetical protein